MFNLKYKTIILNCNNISQYYFTDCTVTHNLQWFIALFKCSEVGFSLVYMTCSSEMFVCFSCLYMLRCCLISCFPECICEHKPHHVGGVTAVGGRSLRVSADQTDQHAARSGVEELRCRSRWTQHHPRHVCCIPSEIWAGAWFLIYDLCFSSVALRTCGWQWCNSF